MKHAVPDKKLVEDPNFERSSIMMREMIKFSDLGDGTKAAAGRGYDELHDSLLPDLIKQLNDSLE